MSLSIQNQNKIISIEADKVQLLKNTVCKGSSDDELELFLHVCNRTGLDPFRNQIYAIKRGDKMTIQTGIDGFRLIAERTSRYSPGKEPSFNYDTNGKLVSATSYIKKQTGDGSWHEVCATAFWAEYVQEYNGKPSKFWQKMPHTMLSKVAESICLRKAFPADFSGIYTSEEMSQADNESETIKTVVNPLPIEIKEKVEIEEPELTSDEIDQYVNSNWGYEFENFKIYMQESISIKNWTYRKCISMFEKNKEKTEKSFTGWLHNKKNQSNFERKE